MGGPGSLQPQPWVPWEGGTSGICHPSLCDVAGHIIPSILGFPTCNMGYCAPHRGTSLCRNQRTTVTFPKAPSQLLCGLCLYLEAHLAAKPCFPQETGTIFSAVLLRGLGVGTACEGISDPELHTESSRGLMSPPGTSRTTQTRGLGSPVWPMLSASGNEFYRLAPLPPATAQSGTAEVGLGMQDKGWLWLVCTAVADTSF